MASLYRHDAKTDAIVEVEPTKIYAPNDWLSQLQPNQVVIGEGLNRVNRADLTQATVCDQSLWAPSAAGLAVVAAEMLNEGQIADTWKLTPQYYRKSAAEEKLAGKE